MARFCTFFPLFCRSIDLTFMWWGRWIWHSMLGTRWLGGRCCGPGRCRGIIVMGWYDTMCCLYGTSCSADPVQAMEIPFIINGGCWWCWWWVAVMVLLLVVVHGGLWVVVVVVAVLPVLVVHELYYSICIAPPVQHSLTSTSDSSTIIPNGAVHK